MQRPIQRSIWFLAPAALFILFFMEIAPATPQDQPDTSLDDIKATITKYLESTGADKEAAWKKIEAYKNLKPEQVPELATFTHGLLTKDQVSAANGKSTPLTFHDRDGTAYDTKYFSYFSGDGTSGKKYPLFLILHSGGGKQDHSKDAARELGWWPKQRDAIAVAPVCRTDASRTLHWNNEPNDSLVAAMIDEAVRHYPVDTNRIYLIGCSMGGWAGWSIGPIFADRFAGIVSASGGAYVTDNPFPMINLYHVPMYVHHGGEENPKWSRGEPSPKLAIDLMTKWKKEHGGGFDVTVVNKNGQGHCLSSDGERDAMMKWLSKSTRDPYPKKIIWQLDDFSRPYFYWLKLDKPKKGPMFTAEAKDNRIEIKAKNYKSGLTVFVNDKLVDMSKPVTVVIDGKQKFSAMVEPSLAVLVETLEARKDLEMAFWGKIKLE